MHPEARHDHGPSQSWLAPVRVELQPHIPNQSLHASDPHPRIPHAEHIDEKAQEMLVP